MSQMLIRDLKNNGICEKLSVVVMCETNIEYEYFLYLRKKDYNYKYLDFYVKG